MITSFWQSSSRKARVGLVAGAVALLALTAAAAWWLLRPDYQVLFSDLNPADTATMTAELERLKVPYSLADDGESGTAILVDRSDVYRTRIKLMGKEIPLHGAVGFELFNNSDFGMTEFAQRINYQRALQGELTRTILSLDEIRDARVLLALPEQGLFKQATSKAKASVTLALKHGRSLRPEQVTGIQRLVSAAVPGIAAQDVTIVDQSGIALTRAAGDGDAESSAGRLDLKKDTEAYLARKAIQVLERTLGPGQALASVDVTLDMDRIQTTVEDVIAAPGKLGGAQTGVVVRERETLREMAAPLNVRASTDPGGPAAGSSQRETEYAVGRRVEQVVGQPGSIRRIEVVAVVKKALDPMQHARIRDLVAASVGASPERGDTVVVQSIEGIASSAGAPPGSDAPAGAATPDGHGPPTLATGARRERRDPIPRFAIGVIVAIAAATAVWVSAFRRRRTASAMRTARAEPALSDAERQAALAQVQAWMRGRAPGPQEELR